MVRVFALLAVLAPAVAIFAACGGDDNSSTATATSAPTGSAGSWTISGQLTGSIDDLTTSACQLGGQAGPRWGAQIAGTLNGTTIGIFFASSLGGTLDLSQGSIETAVSVHYGAVGSPINDYWLGLAGVSGATGSVTIDTKGSGTMNVTLPPSAGTPSGATQPITISGQWVCP